MKVRKGHASPGPSVALPMPLLTSDGDRDKLLTVKKDWARPTQLDSWEFAEDHCCVDGIVIEPSLLSLNLSGLVAACVCTLKSLACLRPLLQQPHRRLPRCCALRLREAQIS
jgi:hypothetical protein